MSDPVLDENTANTTERNETEHVDDADELVTESLVEEVSIDGMCGVY